MIKEMKINFDHGELILKHKTDENIVELRLVNYDTSSISNDEFERPLVLNSFETIFDFNEMREIIESITWFLPKGGE